jgi:hypothetical protein
VVVGGGLGNTLPSCKALGYSDVLAFHQLLTRTAGLSPAQYRERFKHPSSTLNTTTPRRNN